MECDCGDETAHFCDAERQDSVGGNGSTCISPSLHFSLALQLLGNGVVSHLIDVALIIVVNIKKKICFVNRLD